MRVPISWLAEFVDVDLTPEQLAERLTLLGMEVKSIERWGADWQNVVVGELLTVAKHPRADRLSLTTVTLGDGEPLEIVCGATNIAPGQRVPVALSGAVLPGDRRIEQTEKMGVTSNGMLCSGDELHLTADADGILILPPDAPLGAPLADLYGDVVLDVDVKPNRGDALSVLGLAREVAAATRQRIRWAEPNVPEDEGPPTDTRLRVDVEDPVGCTRFVGRWATGLTIGPSPDRVQMRLLAAGQRPISNVVDASNYVMLELGKPIHTFDAAKVARTADGKAHIVVRRATAGERFETLDHVSRELDPEDLLITDPSGPIGIAGVMGGAESEVGEGTTEVIIESAIFDPVTIRRSAQRHALRSEASSRFEKGQDFRMARIGADRTAELLHAWAGASIAPGRIDTASVEPGPSRVPFRPARVSRLLGADVPADEQRMLLALVEVGTEEAADAQTVTVALEPQPLRVEAAAGAALVAVVPTWRRDIEVEADVAEEIARVRGYELTPSITPHTPMPPFRPSPIEARQHLRTVLAGAGLTEAVTPALVSPGHLEAVRLTQDVPSVAGDPPPGGQPVIVTNPLSRDHSVLRQSLIPSLLDVVATNLRHGTDDIAIFEVGKGYARDGDGSREWWRLGLALIGAATPAHHAGGSRPWDLDDAKGLIDLASAALGFDPPIYRAETAESAFHPGRTARVDLADRLHGIVGEVHPSVAEAWELRTQSRLIVAELALAGLSGGRLRVEPVPALSRFPDVERDLAIVLPATTAAGDVAAAIRSSAGDLLRDLRLFDVYRGAPLGADEKSLAWRLTFQARERTLTEAEVEGLIAGVVRTLEGELGARIRS